MHPYLDFFGHSLPTYAICAILGIIFSLALALIRSRSKYIKLPTGDVFFTFLVIIIGTMIGAKIFQLIGAIVTEGGEPDFWTIENWKSMIYGTGVFYGGLVGGVIGGLIGCRMFKIRAKTFADLVPPSITLFHAFGRVGCFMAGCCYGKESAWGITFPDGVTRIPVQLISAGVNLLFTVILLCLKPKKEKEGQLFAWYGVFYAVGRFIIEFFRGDEHRGVFILSTSQWLSIPVLAASVVTIVLINKKATQKEGLN